jgi:hypothetical protein
MSLSPTIPVSTDVALKGDPAWLAELQQKLDTGELTKEQWAALQTHFRQNAFAPIQPSIVCKDSACPYFQACPLQRNQIPRPVDKPCPIEETARAIWAEAYTAEVRGLEGEHFLADVGAACDLINVLLHVQRVQWELVKNPEVAERTIVGFDKDGEVIVDIKMNPLYFTLRALLRTKKEIQESLVMTREARAKDTSRKTQDMAQLLSQARGMVDKMKGAQVTGPDGSPLPLTTVLARLTKPEQPT